jgi:prevent-host-death family protein
MASITSDVQSLATFRRRSGDFMRWLKRTKRPMTLTVNGKPAVILQDVAAYQRLLDIAAQADVREGMRQALQDVKKGKSRPAKEFFAEFEAAHGIKR